MNQPAKPTQLKDLPMEDLKAAKEEVEAEEDAPGQPDSSSSSNSASKSTSSGHMNGHANGVTTETNVMLEDKNDEITESPLEETTTEPERPVRDIRFGDLPHPRKHERDNSEGIPSLLCVLTFSYATQ